jgi:hypothetical protein
MFTMNEGCLQSALDPGYKGVSKAVEGETLAPWVCIRFESVDEQAKTTPITVGNRSAPGTTPEKHAAVIKSFEFGQSDGWTVRVVIHDQQGGSFEDFMRHLFDDWRTSAPKPGATRMKFQFGWSRASCGFPLRAKLSPCFYTLLDGIETSFMEGKFIAELTGKSVGMVAREGATEEVIGGDGKDGVCLRDAIVKHAKDPDLPPSVEDVQFVKIVNNQDGQPVQTECGFKNFDPACTKYGGIKGKWHANSLDKLHTIHTWLSQHPTEDDRPWRVSFDPTTPGERMLIHQANQLVCKGPLSQICVGVYVVNGGKDSPVIEFNPKIKWDFTMYESVGGGSSNQSSNPLVGEDGRPSSKTKGIVDCQKTMSRSEQPGAGQERQIVTTENLKNREGEEADRIAYEATSKHALANMRNLYHDEIEADLVIVGDPSFINPWLLQEKQVGIKFINPFFITKDDGGPNCGDWLAKPPLNKVLTSDAWRIRSVTHKIDMGSYTTTMRVALVKGDVAPGAT